MDGFIFDDFKAGSGADVLSMEVQVDFRPVPRYGFFTLA